LRQIEIEIKGKGKALAVLDDRNPGIAEALWQTLPIEAKANLWGEEVYFEIPLEMEDERPTPASSCRRRLLLVARPGLLHILRADAALLAGQPSRQDYERAGPVSGGEDW
jgi:hypothetical protein